MSVSKSMTTRKRDGHRAVYGRIGSVAAVIIASSLVGIAVRCVSATYHSFSPPLQKERPMLVAITQPVLDLIFDDGRPPGHSDTGESKTDCQMRFAVGSSGINTGRTFKRLKPDSLRLCAIMARDDLAGLVTKMIGHDFDNWRMVHAASATRLSAVVPGPGSEGHTRIYTTRPGLADKQAAAEAVEEEIKKPDVDFVFLGSFTASDNPLVDRVVRIAHQQKAPVYVMPTSDQIRAADRFLPTATSLWLEDWLQVNETELKAWTRRGTVMDGVNWARNQGVAASFMVTAADGVYCFDARQQDWWFHRAFHVPVRSDRAAGDSVAGTALAYLTSQAGIVPDPMELKRLVRYCAAAAAIHVSGREEKEQFDWTDLDQFARTTVLQPIQKTKRAALIRKPSSESLVRLGHFAAGATAAGFVYALNTVFAT